MKPYKIIQDVIKEYKITPDMLPDVRDQVAFLRSQSEEMKAMAWRELMNVVHAKGLQESGIEALEHKGRNNELEHRNALRQAVQGVARVETLISEMPTVSE